MNDVLFFIKTREMHISPTEVDGPIEFYRTLNKIS